jgi:hypothetical protein
MTHEERRAHWSTLIEKQTKSGLSAAAFCREHHINADRFYAWRRRLAPKQIPDPHGGFLQLIPTSKGRESGIRVVVDRAIAIELDRGFDPATLRAAVETLSLR